MIITDFNEIVAITLKRQNKTRKELAANLGYSDVYLKDCIEGKKGKRAKEIRQEVAQALEIVYVEN